MSEPARQCCECGAPQPAWAAADEACAICLMRAALEVPPAEGRAGTVGDYELMEPVGRGGMGVVWRARQISLRREVALKVMGAGWAAGDAEFARFRTEAEAAASLDHPNIVPVYEVGELEGRPFFTMKLVEGQTLAQRLAGGAGAFTPEETGALMGKVARALQHAHERGVLHRDIKPGNILLDGVGEPYLADFGLARLAGAEGGLTLSGAALGTPAYMAPEMAEGRGRHATTAADVYGLGAILYQMLTGRPPFTGDTPLATLRAVVETDVVRPSSLNQRTDRDLETICLKCLEKDPARRYPTAAALAADLERWQRHEPIHARASGTWDRTRKWVRRRPALAGLIATAVAGAAAGIALLLVTNRTIRHEKDAAISLQKRAEGGEKELQLQLYCTDMSLASTAVDAGDFTRANGILERHRPAPGALDLRGPEWAMLWHQCNANDMRTFDRKFGPVFAMAAHPTLPKMYLGVWDMVVLLDLTTGEHERAILGSTWQDMPPDAAPATPESPEDAAIRLLGRIKAPEDSAHARLVRDLIADKATLSALTSLKMEGIFSVSVTADTRLIATAGIGRCVSVSAPASGSGSGKIPAVRQWMMPQKAEAKVLFSPVAPLLAVAVVDMKSAEKTKGDVFVYDLQQGVLLAEMSDAGATMAFSTDGKLLATAISSKQEIKLWEMPSGRLLRAVKGIAPVISGLAFKEDGKQLLVSHWYGHSVYRVDLRDYGELPWLSPPDNGRVPIMALGPHGPGGQFVALGGNEFGIRLMDIRTSETKVILNGRVPRSSQIEFSADGLWVAAGAVDYTFHWWPAFPQSAGQRAKIDNERYPSRRMVSPDLKWIAAATDTQAVPLIEIRTGARKKIGGKGTLSHEFWSREGEGVLVCSVRRAEGGPLELEWWDVAGNAVLRALTLENSTRVERCRMPSEDGSMFACGYQDGSIAVWRVADGRCVFTARTGLKLVTDLALSADGAMVAAWHSANSRAFIFHTANENGVPVSTTVDKCRALNFSPDSKLMTVTRLDDGIVYLVSAATGEVTDRIPGTCREVHAASWSHDQRVIASAATDSKIRLFRTDTMREVAVRRTIGEATSAHFGPGDRILVGNSFWWIPPLDECTASAPSPSPGK